MGKENLASSVFIPAESRGSKTPEERADTIVYLAITPEVEGISGKYFQNREQIETPPISYDKESAQKLWQISLDITELDQSHENND